MSTADFDGQEPGAEQMPGQESLLDGAAAGQLTMVDEVEATSSDADEATKRSKEWIGLPAFRDVQPPARAVISFESPRDRQRFFEELGIKTVHKGTRGTLSVWWPDKPKEDLSSLRFVVEEVA